jgi:hypothetical protein
MPRRRLEQEDLIRRAYAEFSASHHGDSGRPLPSSIEEQQVEATQRHRFDGEEVAGEQARRLATQKGRRTHRLPARRGAPARPSRSHAGPCSVRSESRARAARRRSADSPSRDSRARVGAPARAVPDPSAAGPTAGGTSTSCAPARDASCSSVAGVTTNPCRRPCGSSRASAAMNARSAGRSRGRCC